MNRSIDRKRTAIGRNSLSRPMSLLMKENILSERFSIFDWGYGQGGDI